MNLSNTNFQFDFFFYFPTLSYQPWDLSSPYEIIPNSYSNFSLYYSFGHCILFWFDKVMNTYIMNKVPDYWSFLHSRLISVSLTTWTFKSLSLSGKTTLIADFLYTCNYWPYYFDNSWHHMNTKDNVKTINQELRKPQDWMGVLIRVY